MTAASGTAMARGAVCVFSGLAGPNAGGVQASGRIAWRAVAGHVRVRGGSAGLLVYGGAGAEDLHLADRGSIASASRGRILLAALSRPWRAPVACFWHLHMLRLLPLMRLGRSRVVLFLHGIEVWRDPGPLLRRLLGRVDLFLSNTDFTWRRFLEFHPRLAGRPHRTVHLGEGRPAGPRGEAPSDPPTALILGRLMRDEDYKGHRELIGVWPEVARRVPGARLWVVGDGDLRPDLERMARRLNLAGQVTFWGRVDEDRKQELLAQCRCLAMPSRGEGFGLVYLEAMRRGRPCLVGEADAGEEVVNSPEAGLAADPRHADALAAALCRLLTASPEWDRWSAAARARYEALFTADHFQDRLLRALFGDPAGDASDSPKEGLTG
jgi:phosphatidylinositol alpha-1,6-mannosyltransferase